MSPRPHSDLLAPPSDRDDGLGFGRAMAWVFAFDLLLALLIFAARGGLQWLR